MCLEPEYELPPEFIATLEKYGAQRNSESLVLELAPDMGAMVEKIAEQTGFPASAVANALLETGVSSLRSRGILY